MSRVVRVLLLFLWSVAVPPPGWAQPVPGGAIEGVVSTQAATIRLPGAVITLTDADGVPVAQQIAEGDGTFRLTEVARGVYRISASLEGFRVVETSVTVLAGQTARVELDLPIADVSERVEVVAPLIVAPRGETIAPGSSVESREIEQYAPGGGFQAALRLLAPRSKCRAASASRAGDRTRRRFNSASAR